MRALVAGGAGFIGSSLCRRMLERGNQVVCVDSLLTGRSGNVEELADHPGFSFVQADVTRSLGGPNGPLAGLQAPLDAVLNLACPASPADFGPLALEILDVGSRGVAQLLETAMQHGAVYLQASTSEVYGDPKIHPQPETYWGNVNPIGPRSVYDEAKRFGEALTMAYHRRHGLETRVVRIFNTYGPRMRPDDGRVVSNFVTQALRGEPLTVYGDGSQTRSFCYVDDLVEGILALLGSAYRAPVNIGNNEERTVLETARLVLELTGSASPIVHVGLPQDDPTQRCPDLSVAARELDWRPKTPMREGLAKAVAWFADNMER